ncbi:MAG: hypothetical protein J0H69_19625 [Burkholderiales bacterium]|nr:hypothetical protein [Burkholderiales bacterium]
MQTAAPRATVARTAPPRLTPRQPFRSMHADDYVSVLDQSLKPVYAGIRLREPGTQWHVTLRMEDQQGREWRHSYDAVMDDFGSLVEVTC